ncbi:hypothetical protein DW103_17070 [Parabacteroides sp. AM08-6]|nr:hypothetical protein DW103_17070 [Parabacteroides sp. AM08-6]
MGALGAGVTVAEGFNKSINSSQTLSDEYNRTLDGLKGTVDNLFYSFANGDWSPFLQGLSNSIQLAREAYTALDQLGNTKMSYGYFNMKNQAGLQEQIAILKDKNSTAEQKALAEVEAKKIIADQKEITEQLSRRSFDALRAIVQKSTGFDNLDVSQMNLEKIFRLDVSAMGDEEKAKLSAMYDEFKKRSIELQKQNSKVDFVQSGITGVQMKTVVDQDKFKEALKPLLKQYEDAIYYNSILVKESDEWLKNVLGIGSEAFIANRTFSSMVKSMNRASQSESIISTPKKEKESFSSGSIGAVKAEISELQKKYEQAADDGTRIGLNKAIKEAKTKLDRMLFASDLKPIAGPAFIEHKGKNPASALGDKIKPVISNNDVRVTQDYNEALSSTLNMIQAIGSATGEGAAGWLSYGVNCVTALGNTYQALQKVIPALMVKATVEAAGSAAGTPIVGWITAIAAVGAMMAAFSSLPKYETGGIVSGTSYRGDNILARVNSGELILNRAQQRNIAYQLTAGAATRVDVNVIGHISGRDLEFVMDKRKRYNERVQ